jgi:ABC-2 type transport system ATP-binding protein|uniref:ATP-binding cassette domain-containing protein n=1 Tax=Candidatus Limnocylindrus sp. TaxID=2802978 RepID=UPI00404965A3
MTLSVPTPISTSPAPAISVRDLVKRYKGADRNAVDGVSFDVAQGSLFALLGPNGAGKTTTISILTTTLAATSGSVQIAGADLAHDQSEVRRRVGIIFQKPSLDRALTGEENCRFHAALYGAYAYRPAFSLMPREYRERIVELGALVGLDREDLFKKISKYSGGMRRKLEIARSLLHRPQVLFLDEPTVGLDPESRRSVAGYLDAIRRSEKTTMVLTTHYLDEVEIADQVCIIDRGKIVANGTPAELRTGTGVTRVEFEAADRVALSAEVEKLGHTPQPISAGVAVEVLGAEAAHALVRDLKTPLTRFEVRSPSLEDAYLKIVAATADDREESPLDDTPRRSFRR